MEKHNIKYWVVCSEENHPTPKVLIFVQLNNKIRCIE